MVKKEDHGSGGKLGGGPGVVEEGSQGGATLQLS